MTDHEYIKMILALPDEFFDGWEWQAGDKAVNILNNRIIVFLWKTEPDAWKTESTVWYYNYYPSFSNKESSSIKLSEIRPFPSQEQLQKMLIDFENEDSKYKHSNYFIISERFIAVVIEGDLVADMENKTLTEMWLEFVVYLMYNKTWNGEKWL